MIDSKPEVAPLWESNHSDRKGESEQPSSEERGGEANFANCYEDVNRANAYATLEFANTYYLAYRDLPEIVAQHVIGTRAMDFGCGTGRSTRFLRKLGLTVTGVDISADMLQIARACERKRRPSEGDGAGSLQQRLS